MVTDRYMSAPYRDVTYYKTALRPEPSLDTASVVATMIAFGRWSSGCNVQIEQGSGTA